MHILLHSKDLLTKLSNNHQKRKTYQHLIDCLHQQADQSTCQTHTHNLTTNYAAPQSHSK